MVMATLGNHGVTAYAFTARAMEIATLVVESEVLETEVLGDVHLLLGHVFWK
jgi:hypothetical protein